MAAFSLSTIIDIICGIVSEMCGDDKEHLKAVQLMKKENDKVRTSNTVHVGNSRIDEEIISRNMKEENTVPQIRTGKRTLLAKKLLTGACMSVTFLLCLSRTASNYVNYGGEHEIHLAACLVIIAATLILYLIIKNASGLMSTAMRCPCLMFHRSLTTFSSSSILSFSFLSSKFFTPFFFFLFCLLFFLSFFLSFLTSDFLNYLLKVIYLYGLF